MCPIQQKNWVPFWSVILSAQKRFHFQVWYIYIYAKGTSFLESQNAIFSRPIFVIHHVIRKLWEREREREIAIYIMALSYTQLEKLNGLKPLHVRLNLEFDMVKIKRVFCNFMNCCWTAAENKTTTHMQVQELQLYARIVTTAIM